jgi:UDP-glucuronate 4-epimerase
MRVLITGGSGFIGTHLIKKLLSDGHDIYNVDKVHSRALPPDKQTPLFI